VEERISEGEAKEEKFREGCEGGGQQRFVR